MMVVKLGGAAGIDASRVLDEVPSLRKEFGDLVLVHGGSEEGDKLLQALGQYRPPCHTERGIPVRITDAETLRILTMAWAGGINKRLVSRLAARGVLAVGLTGADGALVTAKKRCPPKVCDGQRTWVAREHLAGEIASVNVALLRVLLEHGLTPVLCPPAITSEGCLVNVDADLLAAAIAGAIGATRLVLLSNVPGLLRDPANRSSIIRQIDDLTAYRSLGQGRMQYKLEAATRALEAGVDVVYLGPAEAENPVAKVFSGECGTRITRGTKHG